MEEKFIVTHSVEDDDKGHVLDCSCSCGGPNVSVSNVHSSKNKEENVIIILKGEE
ncbi:hypothetical protein [Rhizobium rhizogenes]|uniref:hypothetical protein n=1 Tax=Rhizobium rhizogenes TaxID=359 RepID=UPI00226E599B|nr:hypothetical protein [Rhizobium rhizogenes]